MAFIRFLASRRATKATAAGAITVAALTACTTQTTKPVPTTSKTPETHESGPLFSRSQSDAAWRIAFNDWLALHKTYKKVTTPDGKGGAYVGANGDVFPWGSLGKSLSASDPLGDNLIGVADSADAAKISSKAGKALGETAQATWLGYWVLKQPDYIATVMANAKKNGEVPLFVFYAISDSENSANSKTSYVNWLDTVIGEIAKQPSIAPPVIVIEPDTLPFTAGDPGSTQSKARLAKVHSAIEKLRVAKLHAYVDIGGPNWLTADVAAQTLKSAGVQDASGFSLNVSNYNSTADSVTYAEKINAALVTAGSKPAHFIVDTGRNGNQVAATSNPYNLKGASYGTSPTTVVSVKLLDAQLWIKNPLQSDQNTKSGQYASADAVPCPPAGQFCDAFADELLKNHHEVKLPNVVLSNDGKSLSLSR